MDLFNVIGLVLSAIGCVTGSVALFQSHKANKVAEQSLGVGEEANVLSSESNGLSSDANQIGEDANLIGKDGVRVAADQLGYEWAVQFDAETGAMVIINDCCFAARDVRVVVRLEEETIGDVHADDVHGFGQVVLEVPLVCEKLREEASQRCEYFIGPVFVLLDIHIAWVTMLGTHRSIRSQHGFGYAERKEILA